MMAVDDNIVRDMETQSRTLPGRLGCKERLKDPGLDVGRDAGTVIRDLDYNVTICRICFDINYNIYYNKTE